MTSALSLEATPDIQTWVQDHLVQLRRGDTTIEGVAIRYFSGKHRRVFECDLLPGKVLKLEGSIGLTSTLTKMTDSALIAKSLRHCVVPEVSKTEFDAYTLWVEEKLTGTYDPQAAAEKTEREFELCESDPELKELWISRFRDAAQMIVKTDYYDVDWRNVLLMDDGRLGFVDFESVMAEGSKTETGGGLYRLLHEMAPPFAFEAILEVVAEHKLQPFLFTYRGQRHPGPPSLMKRNSLNFMQQEVEF